jgi:hypothetical protein
MNILAKDLLSSILVFLSFSDCSRCRATSKALKGCVEFVFQWHTSLTCRTRKLKLNHLSRLEQLPSNLSHLYLDDTCIELSPQIAHLTNLMFLRVPWNFVGSINLPPDVKLVVGLNFYTSKAVPAISNKAQVWEDFVQERKTQQRQLFGTQLCNGFHWSGMLSSILDERFPYFVRLDLPEPASFWIAYAYISDHHLNPDKLRKIPDCVRRYHPQYYCWYHCDYDDCWGISNDGFCPECKRYAKIIYYICSRD